jgi:hypothetical protein
MARKDVLLFAVLNVAAVCFGTSGYRVGSIEFNDGYFEPGYRAVKGLLNFGRSMTLLIVEIDSYIWGKITLGLPPRRL